MSVSEIFKTMYSSFFSIYGGTNIGMLVYLLTFARRGVFVSDIFGIFIISVLLCVTFILFYSKKNLTGKSMFIRIGIHYVTNLGVFLLGATYFGWLIWGMIEQVILLPLLFTVTYVLIAYKELYEVRKLAEDLNQKLQQRKER